jgi:hypothetical protein
LRFAVPQLIQELLIPAISQIKALAAMIARDPIMAVAAPTVSEAAFHRG